MSSFVYRWTGRYTNIITGCINYLSIPSRYYAILKPLKISGIDSRTRIMLATAWVAAAICSAPQAYIFNLSRHPQAPEYKNCKSLGHSHSISIYYQIISWLLFYALPLAVIVFCYFSIYTKIYRRTKKALSGNGKPRRRCSKSFQLLITTISIRSNSPKNKHGRSGPSEKTDFENDRNDRNCLYHLLVTVQYHVHVVRIQVL